MTLKANEAPRTGGKPQEPIDPGSYPGRLVQVIDLGLQPQTYNNEEKPPKNEILTTYEFADEFMKDEEGNEIKDKPRWLSETFALNSLNSDKAKSTQRYFALDPDARFDGDWSKLLGSPATITVINKAGTGKNKGKTFNNIASVSTMRPKDASRLPDLVNDAKFFTLDDPDVELFLTLPPFIQDKIKKGLEFEGGPLDKLLQKHKGNAKTTSSGSTVEAEETPDEEEEDNANW